MNRLPLRVRLSVTYAAVVALLMLALGSILYVTMRQLLGIEMDRRLDVRSSQIQLALWPGPDSPTAAGLTPGKVDLSPLADLDAPNVSVQVMDRSGELLATSDNLQALSLPLDRQKFEQAVQGRTVLFDLTLPSGRQTRVLNGPIWVGTNLGHDVVGVLQVVQGRTILNDTMSGLRGVLLLLGAIGVVTAAATGWFVSYQGLKPLSIMSEQAEQIASKRDFSRRLHARTGGRDEVGRLARTINDLLARVEETLRAHRDFLADTSHELRNPVLALRTNLELLDRVRDADAREECIREGRLQVERMSRLVSDLLLLAQVESSLVVERRPVELTAVAERSVRAARQQASGQDIVVDCPSASRIFGDEGRIGQILTNLLDNAVKHTPAGGKITVRVRPQDGGACLSVEDTGEGISAEHLPRIFDRSYQASSNGGLAHDTGHGLGLAIVKHLAEAHRGHVAAESALGQGTCVSVWFPAMRNGHE